MDGIDFRLDANTYSKENFADDVRPFIEKLKRNKSGIAVLTLHGGTKYEMTIPGYNKGQPIPLGEWKEIAERMVRIMKHDDIGILDASKPAANTHKLDQAVINKTGVTFDGAVRNHTPATTPIYKELRERIKKFGDLEASALKKSIPSPKALEDEKKAKKGGKKGKAPVADDEGNIIPTTEVKPLGNLPSVDGLDEHHRAAIQNDIEVSCGVAKETPAKNGDGQAYLDETGRIKHWATLANALTTPGRNKKTKAQDTFEKIQDEIPNNVKAQVKNIIDDRYLGEALNVYQEGIEYAIDKEIEKYEGWRKADANEVTDFVTKTIRSQITTHIAKNGTIKNKDLLEAIKKRNTSPVISQSVAIRLELLRSGHQGLGIGARAFKKIPKSIQNLTNLPGSETVGNMFGWLGGLVNDTLKMKNS